MFKRGFVFYCLLNIAFLGFAQKKSITAIRDSGRIVVDGVLNDLSWCKANAATDFVQYEPFNGVSPYKKTEVFVLYNDDALYIGAKMYDTAPDSILREFAQRDNDYMNADYFSVSLLPFNDGQNEYLFTVSAANIQSDVRSSGNFTDYNWNAVWESEVSISHDGWICEIRIPYSAIRFPDGKNAPWGINFWRSIRRNRELSSWNFVDNSLGGKTMQSGELIGVVDVDAPLRLSFMPYLSAYYQLNPNSEGTISEFHSVNGGMDLKFGLNESFTLDMTLIPDFGQVQSDNAILNLTPFEVKYDENRQFFTEGTEMFSRADLFYSRRIGSTPKKYYDVYTDGIIVKSNPSETRLLNATKLSGRTKRGLGVGAFNAITGNTYAIIDLSGSAEERLLTQPLTNYNIFVVDQTFGKNSYLSLINTNTFYDRGGEMANVSGSEFKFADKKNKYRVFGKGAISQCYDASNQNPKIGFRQEIDFGKVSGNFRFDFVNRIADATFDPNDLGYLNKNNYIENNLSLSYNVFKPFYRLIGMGNTLTIGRTARFSDGNFTSLSLNGTVYGTFKNYLSVKIQGTFNPKGEYDYYEPRVENRYFKKPASYYSNIWFSSDYRKRFALDGYFGYFSHLEDLYKYSFWFGFSPRVRLNDHCLLIYNFSRDNEWDDNGFVRMASDSIIFGRRDVARLTNSLSTNYVFNSKMIMKLKIRHYWSYLKYKELNSLNKNGLLDLINGDLVDNQSFNAFNIDFGFTWYFAPGSELNLVWKNQILGEDKDIPETYFDDIKGVVQKLQSNSFSVRIIYYLDYQSLMKKKI